ncbi:unnamed protein product [Thelazia callipaeda]|uniref:MAP7 domain-containing protein 2 n=1 Tax=Thelazia callipaeda TaxID=103827 RepID=A0A0N5D716_THECL|nr:unnamed protein product [Thelazia callipaeda]
MNRCSNSYLASARKDNSEEVARRRAAMLQQIEQRQKLARKLQEEKMARAVAQKEERLLKQRELQQREMLRAKAVLDRRAQVLAEKEKEKKEAALAKIHAVASRLMAKGKSRPAYAFGSSTPRELGYLTQLSKEQKVYDSKLVPSNRSPTATSGSSGRLTSTPCYGTRSHTPRATMTRSFYVAQSQSKKPQKPVVNNMTQSVIIPTKPVKLNQTSVHGRSLGQCPRTAAKTLLPATATVTKVESRLSQPYASSVSAQINSKKKNEALKAKTVSRISRNELKENTESIGVRTGSENTVMIPITETQVQINVACPIVENTDEQQQNMNLNGIENLDKKNDVIESSVLPFVLNSPIDLSLKKEEIKEEAKINEIGKTNFSEADISDNRKEIVVPKVAMSDVRIIETAEDFVPPNNKNEPKVIGALKEEKIDHVYRDEEVEPVTKQTQEVECSTLPETEQNESSMLKTDQDDLVTDYSNLVRIPSVAEIEKNSESNMQIAVPEESAVVDGKLSDPPKSDEEKNQPCVMVEVSESDTEKSAVKEEKKIVVMQSSLTPKTNDAKVFDDLKLAEEKDLFKERRRIQDELLEKEQREREMRKAKLASIMSRTRGLPPMAVVAPTKNLQVSEVISQDTLSKDRITTAVEPTSIKAALSHTTASVLQKLATTNPKLLSVLQRNGSSQSLADELSAADPSMSMTLPSQPV